MSIRPPCIDWADKLVLRQEDLSPADRTALHRHLAECSVCAVAYTDYHLLIARLRALPTLDGHSTSREEQEGLEPNVAILSRWNKNNPALIGESGVGKTAIGEGFAQHLVAGEIPKSDELRAKLNEKQLPSESAAKVRKEIDCLEQTPPQSAEIAGLRSYIVWILALPWTERTEDAFDLERTMGILDEDHYGLEGIKERIIDFLAVRQLRQRQASQSGQAKRESQGQILCLIGPPGVGKTSLGQSIAHALGRKFARISLGGVHDEAEIRGHRRTYVGALPGRIIQSMKTVGVRNPVFLLDEIDKLSTEYRGDPSAALLEVLDPEQNKVFVDHYLEVPLDLSEVFFICTGNVKYQIPRALADRMDIINIPGYMWDEKVNIAQGHRWPRVWRENGLSPERVKITKPVMQRIITDYTHEAGIRNLERQLAAICRKAARKILEKPNVPVRITAHNLEQ